MLKIKNVLSFRQAIHSPVPAAVSGGPVDELENEPQVAKALLI